MDSGCRLLSSLQVCERTVGYGAIGQVGRIWIAIGLLAIIRAISRISGKATSDRHGLIVPVFRKRLHVFGETFRPCITAQLRLVCLASLEAPFEVQRGALRG